MHRIVIRCVCAAWLAAAALAADRPGNSPSSQVLNAAAAGVDFSPAGNCSAVDCDRTVFSAHSVQPGRLSDESRFTYRAADTGGGVDGDPPQLPTCPGDSLLGQNPDSPTAFTAYVSEANANQRRYEKFNSVAGAITGVRWFGLHLRYLGGGQWTDCTETDNTFTVSFHEIMGGVPGAAVCSYALVAQRIPTRVNYGGFELNEYRVTLPSSCVITNGFLSVQGQGDPDCWFLWMSSANGDQFHYCQGCQSNVQQDDVAFCLLGTPGGIFGACCYESTGECFNNVEINQCSVPGTRFTPNTTCANLNPPCQVVTGACCFPNNTCSILTSAQCNVGGGNWLGGGTSCAQCPVLGACCLGFKSCTFEQEFGCLSEGGVWMGPDTECADCPDEPVCPKDSLWSQNASDPFDFLAGTSEESANIRRWENFSGVPGPIHSLTWWGLDMQPAGANQWIKCDESDPTFKISFHKDAANKPGDLVAQYTLLATRTPLNINFNGSELNRYEVTLPAPVTMVRGWISIVGLGNPNCWFLWMSSGIGGYSWCDRCMPHEQDMNLAVCLQGPYGGVFGSCCMDSIGWCQDNIEMSACINNDQRFTPNVSCAQLDPPCGVILGACCYPNDTCAQTEQTPCQNAGGNWTGATSICVHCPCITPCPAGGVTEGEQNCAPNYEDVFNGGCIVPKPNFSPLAIGQTVCGTSGVFLMNGNVMGDFDWYEVNVGFATTLTWTVRAEFRSRIWIFDGNHGCSTAAQLAFAAATECFTYSISSSVQPGRYWCVFGPLAFDDAAQCGARYFATATMVSCTGDIAPTGGDGAIGVPDLLMVINNWGPCSNPNSCPADIAPAPSGDDSVGVPDLLLIINNWGPCVQ